MSVRDLIIIGAGPSGLSAAIAARQRNLDAVVLEQGTLVNSIYHFPPQLVFFTTPELLEIGGLPFVSPNEKPTRMEALKYYRKVVDKYDLPISFDEKALSITPEPNEAMQAGEATLFSVETRSSRGVRRARLARNVVLAIGYYDHPVMLNVPGEDLPHVHHYYKEPHPYYRQRVVVVGGGNSAAETALELHRAGAQVTLVHRRPALRPTIKYWVRPDIENRIKEGSIAARFDTSICEIRPASVVLMPAPASLGGEPAVLSHSSHAAPAGTVRVTPATGEATLEAEAHERVAHEYEMKRIGNRAGKEGPESTEKNEIPCDAVFVLTGYRADSRLMTEAGIALTERSGPVYNAETFETNVPGLYVAGGALAGVDTGTVFIENGRFHGEKIVEAIARRRGPG